MSFSDNQGARASRYPLVRFSLYFVRVMSPSSYKKVGMKKRFLKWSIGALILFALAGNLALYLLISSGTLSAGQAAVMIGVFYVLSGVLGILMIIRMMVQPVISLTEKVRQVQEGNLDVDLNIRVNPASSDEMDMLYIGFKEMVTKLRENITELQKEKNRAEQMARQLMENNKKLERIFEGLPDGVMIIDKEYRIRHVNPVMEKMIGRGLEEVQGELCYSMCQGHSERCSFCRADSVFQLGGHAFTMCTRKQAGTEENRIMEIYDIPILDEHGDVELVIEYVKDVTEAAKLQQHLEQARHLAEIGKMASIVSHEVRNPLNAISGAIHYLEGEISDTELRSYLNLIVEQIQRVKGVTDELLDYARPIKSEFSLEQIGPVIEKAIALVRSALDEKDVCVELNIDESLPLLPLDTMQVERALVNLLLNAIDVVNGDGRIAISATYVQDVPENTLRYVEVRVQDNGPGLGDRDPEELFKPFVSTKLRGTGLGLPIVRKIMDSHQGSIRLFSENSRGTTAILHFPTVLKVYEAEEHHTSYR